MRACLGRVRGGRCACGCLQDAPGDLASLDEGREWPSMALGRQGLLLLQRSPGDFVSYPLVMVVHGDRECLQLMP